MTLLQPLDPRTPANPRKKFKNEGDVKQVVKKILKESGAWYFSPVSNGMGVHGIPDFVVCLCGIFVGIETKYGKGKLSEWQKMQGEGITKAGGEFLVINEKNVHDLAAYLSDILDV